MNYLVPAWEIDLETKKRAREAALKSVVETALLQGLADDVSSLTIRKIEPSDLGLTSWHIITSQVGGFSGPTWISHRQGNAILGIYKLTVLSADPLAEHINIANNSSMLLSADLSELYAPIPLIHAILHDKADEVRITDVLLDHPTDDLDKMLKDLRCEAYFQSAMISRPGNVIHVMIKPPSTNDIMVIVGYIAERKGTTIV